MNGSRSITPKNGALRMHHHAVRSWEDALIKDRIWCAAVRYWQCVITGKQEATARHLWLKVLSWLRHA